MVCSARSPRRQSVGSVGCLARHKRWARKSWAGVTSPIHTTPPNKRLRVQSTATGQVGRQATAAGHPPPMGMEVWNGRPAGTPPVGVGRAHGREARTQLMLQLLHCCHRASGQPRVHCGRVHTAAVAGPQPPAGCPYRRVRRSPPHGAGTVRATAPPVGRPCPWAGGRGCWAHDPWKYIWNHGDAGASWLVPWRDR